MVLRIQPLNGELLTNLNLNKDQSKKMIELSKTLEDLDDVQNVFTNANLDF